MKHIKPYKIFESNEPNFPTTKEGVIQVCEKYKIKNYTINDDLSIEVDGNVHLVEKELEYLPLKFNYVSGSFYCYKNELKSLKGCPQTVGTNFECSYNKLKTLEGCPQTVGGYFDCFGNELKSLEGCPQTVFGYFNCGGNELKSLKGCPQTVDGNFSCYFNKLKTLEGGPQTVGGDFNCYSNKLTDLEHFPEVNGTIDIKHNTVNLLVYTFIENEETDSFMIEDFNDYEIVRNRDTVMLDRLQTFIRDNDLEMPDLEEIKKEYKIIE
jgi:hypothetical protein